MSEETKQDDYWYDVPSEEMTLAQARRAVRELRRKLAEHLDQESCEDAVSRSEVNRLCNSYLKVATDEHVAFYEHFCDLPSVKPTTCIAQITFSKEDLQKLVDEKVEEIKESMCKTGKWIIDDKEHGRIWHCHCSNCKKDPQDYIGGTENWWLVRLPDYCPNCGAKMDKE